MSEKATSGTMNEQVRTEDVRHQTRGNYDCTMCNRNFNSLQGLEQHTNDAHGELLGKVHAAMTKRAMKSRSHSYKIPESGSRSKNVRKRNEKSRRDSKIISRKRKSR